MGEGEGEGTNANLADYACKEHIAGQTTMSNIKQGRLGMISRMLIFANTHVAACLSVVMRVQWDIPIEVSQPN